MWRFPFCPPTVVWPSHCIAVMAGEPVVLFAYSIQHCCIGHLMARERYVGRLEDF